MQTEGIFRLSASAVVVNQLKDKIENGKFYEVILKELDPHALSSLIKMFLRDLPDPLLTYKLFDVLKQTSTYLSSKRVLL